MNDPLDKGGATNMGITQSTLTAWRKANVSVEDVRNLTRQEALAIYRDKYVAGPGFDRLPEILQPIAIDMGVLHGQGTSVKLICRAMGRTEQTKLDDKLLTALIVSGADKALVNKIVDVRNNYFRAIVAKNPSQTKYLKGWLARSERFRLK